VKYILHTVLIGDRLPIRTLSKILDCVAFYLISLACSAFCFIKNLACGAFFSYKTWIFLNRDAFDLKFIILLRIHWW